ncbi:glycoside hydrolase family 2 TIM barrel-domain containing protein [Paenibacillus phytorum]|uniref:glycoside hydrolase family 2 TIM barrel-domain containing protein n=1 Tax=Paenibacillus phytorum TaxID=2654977 RepID=UPI001FE671FE|nr:glycoside hydrolase family 2 TIM barrel-domain containing protein [Paenibacillus phytorum]
MILEFIDGPLDGDSWEKLCNSCYRIKYQDEHFTEIPAVHGGDAGIEGFTRAGRVYQCYCPEREYSDDELYDHLRDKMTKDINKLTSQKYAKRLKEMGVPTIKEWHLVIPHYRDSRIIAHAETKQNVTEMIQRDWNHPSIVLWGIRINESQGDHDF